jgi:hypothetical protein
MNFTIYNDNKINSKILQDMEHIKNTLLNEFRNDIIAILLTGGFGRGEGGILIDNINIDKIKIVNDYDLHVITKRRIDDKKIKKIADELAKMLNVDHTDVVAQPIYTLGLLKNTQYGYDLKHGNYLVYGNKRILDKLPDSNCLPQREIEKLFFTRAWCFLGPVKKSFFDGIFTSEEKFFLFNQLTKALLALEESILILHCDYHPSYVEKLGRVKKYSTDDKLIKYFEWATYFKLKPSYTMDKDPVNSYFEIKDIFFKEMFNILNESYSKNFKSWIEYVEWYPKRFDVKLLILLRFLWNKNLSYNKFIKVKLAQILLAVDRNRNHVDYTLTEHAERILLEIKKLEKMPKDIEKKWWKLKDVALALQDIYMR